MPALPVADIVRLLGTLGPWGLVVISCLVGLALAVIVYARTMGLFAGQATAEQANAFQKNLLEAFDRLSKSDAALRQEVEDLQTERENLRGRIAELTVAIDLMRNQQRRLIDLLHAVMSGRIAPDALHQEDLQPTDEPRPAAAGGAP